MTEENFLICLTGFITLIIITEGKNVKRKKPKRKLRTASTRKNHIPYSKYRIEWFDIASDSGWATDKEFSRMKLATPVSEGWLYEKNECVIKIFASYDKDEDGIVFGERTVIPLS